MSHATEAEVSLASLGTRAVEGIEKLQEAISNEARGFEISVSDIEIEIQRLRLWATNLDLWHEAHGSLDYRLRDAPLIRDLASSLLHELVECLGHLLDIAAGARLPFESRTEGTVDSAIAPQEPPENDSSSSSDGTSSASDGDEPKLGEVQVRWNDLTSIIQKLYKFSTHIRNSSTRAGPGDRPPFPNETPENQNLFLDQLAQLEAKYIESQLERCRTEAQTSLKDIDQLGQQAYHELISRLGKANTIRRQHFKYWRDQSDRRKARARPWSADQKPKAFGKGLAEAPKVSKMTAGPANHMLPTRSLLAPSNPTSVTKVDPKKVRPGGTSVYSRASANKPVQGPVGEEVPWPGTEDLPTISDHFECPYCSLICPISYGKSTSSWRSHVRHDLRPYCCTYPQCEAADILFDSRKEWSNHEKFIHRAVYRCTDHPDQEFDETAYIVHIVSYHSKYTEQMTTGRGLQSATATSKILDRNCPLCFMQTDSLESMDAHMIYHLECIALLSLPRGTGLEKGSQQGDAGSADIAQGTDSRFDDADLETLNYEAEEHTQPAEQFLTTSGSMSLTRALLEELNQVQAIDSSVGTWVQSESRQRGVLDEKMFEDPDRLESLSLLLRQQLRGELLEFVLEGLYYASRYRRVANAMGKEAITTESDEGFELMQDWLRLIDVYVKPGAPREVELLAEERDNLADYPFDPAAPPPELLYSSTSYVCRLIRELVPPEAVQDTIVDSSLSGLDHFDAASFVPVPYEEWRKYFVVGRVFAIPSTEATQHWLGDYVYVDDPAGNTPIAKIHRLVVVESGAESCLVVPITTYDGRGLNGLTVDEVEAHAVIFTRGQNSSLLEREPVPTKSSIPMQPFTTRHVLPEASRVNFAEQYRFRYSEQSRRVLRLGNVSSVVRPFLLKFCEQHRKVSKAAEELRGKREVPASVTERISALDAERDALRAQIVEVRGQLHALELQKKQAERSGNRLELHHDGSMINKRRRLTELSKKKMQLDAEIQDAFYSNPISRDQTLGSNYRPEPTSDGLDVTSDSNAISAAQGEVNALEVETPQASNVPTWTTNENLVPLTEDQVTEALASQPGSHPDYQDTSRLWYCHICKNGPYICMNTPNCPAFVHDNSRTWRCSHVVCDECEVFGEIYENRKNIVILCERKAPRPPSPIESGEEGYTGRHQDGSFLESSTAAQETPNISTAKQRRGIGKVRQLFKSVTSRSDRSSTEQR